LSDAPHAVPHAADFSSGLSAAPHAVPHAAGFSAGLSAAPHAEPASVSDFFHPKRFDNAILLPPDIFVCCYLCCKIIISRIFNRQKYAQFYYIGIKR
jgi:hypothetical protein